MVYCNAPSPFTPPVSYAYTQLALGCSSDYTLLLTLHSYLNPLHTRNTGVCCESPSPPPCPTNTFCDNIFTLCALTGGGQTARDVEDISPAHCSLGYYRSEIFHDNDNITSDPFISVVFSGDVWPVSSVHWM